MLGNQIVQFLRVKLGSVIKAAGVEHSSIVQPVLVVTFGLLWVIWSVANIIYM